MKNVALFLVLILVLACVNTPKSVKNTNVGAALGTSYSIIYIADTQLDFQQEIDSVFKAVNQSMSTYIPSSDISKINNGDTTVVVDAMFKEVFNVSTKVYSASKGYFDPTVGVLVNAWGFGPGEQIQMDNKRVDSLLQYVGWDKVKLSTNGTIAKQNSNIRFDFNAVAKGYAIDCLGRMLTKKGIENYLIEVGGEVLTKGENTFTQKQWTVGIDEPNNIEQRGSAAVIKLKDRALASSGNYRKFRIDSVTGKKYVHSINPLTGYTKNSKVIAANVLANDCATADAYATAFMVMDLEDSKVLLEQKNEELDVFIIYLDDDGKMQEFVTKGFKALIIF